MIKREEKDRGGKGEGERAGGRERGRGEKERRGEGGARERLVLRRVKYGSHFEYFFYPLT